ncbi:unnamed protein product, partial [Oikopleura dioica]
MDRKPSFGEKVKKAVFKSAKKKHKEKNVRENPDYDRLRSNQMSEDRVVAEEECLRQRSRILEQIRELKRIDFYLRIFLALQCLIISTICNPDVDTFHYETLYQTMTDDFEKQIDEMRILEIKSRMAARILEIHDMIQKSAVTVQKLNVEIDDIRSKRLRSYSEPVNQSTPTKKKWRDINEENRQQHVMNYATSTFNRRRDPNGLTMKSYSSMTPASRRRPTAGSTTIIRSKSQSYRETQSDAQLIYKANFLRNINAPEHLQTTRASVDVKLFPDKSNNEVHVKLAERKALMARSVSDVALVERIPGPKYKLFLLLSHLRTLKSESGCS